MKLGTRLLLALLPTVTAIMIFVAGWALVEREQTVVPAAQQEARAYATALGLALDGALRDVRSEQVQAIIDQVSREPTVYGIILYDSAGIQVLASDPLNAPGPPPEALLHRVLQSGTTVTLERAIGEERVFSVLRALHGPRGRITGAVEVAQPMDFVEAQQAQVRRRYFLNTLALLIALTATTLWLVRRVVAQPMERLVLGARELGGGNLAHRIVDEGTSSELAVLASELNRMAGNLEAARRNEAREAEERVGLERRLRETEKLAAIGNLAAGLAHEIAAPLNVISGRAELMLRRVPPETDESRQLQIIIRQISRITTTVQNLLGFAKRREFVPRAIDLGNVLNGVFDFLDAEFHRAGVKVTAERSGSSPVIGDPDLLHDVLVNVLLNAVQALEGLDGERAVMVRLAVSIPLAQLPLAGTPMPAAMTDSRWTIIEVRDNGPGITPEALPQLFEPYFTTKARGTGLGLVVAQSIMQEHGGWLDARNAPAGGAIFRLVLPPAPESMRG
ncbi:MAG: ATP-binding protein [Gemmatimonadales bacterium]